MKKLATFTLTIVGCAAILYIAAQQANAERAAVRPSSDDVVARASVWKHRCPTVDGGVADDIMKDIDGGARNEVTDWTVENDSTTCVRVGFDARTNATHGFRVGSGCPAGAVFPLHARVGDCLSEGPAAVVDVGGGQP